MTDTPPSSNITDNVQDVANARKHPAKLHREDLGVNVHAPQRPKLAPGLSTIGRRSSFIDEEEQPVAEASAAHQNQNKEPVTWSSLPQKSQLAVLTLARLSEPLAERSLAAYMFYQLRWFDNEASDSTIASQGGILTAAFAAAQFLTAVWWGRAADTPWIGRKKSHPHWPIWHVFE